MIEGRPFRDPGRTPKISLPDPSEVARKQALLKAVEKAQEQPTPRLAPSAPLRTSGV